jgi:hypothetical protein
VHQEASVAPRLRHLGDPGAVWDGRLKEGHSREGLGVAWEDHWWEGHWWEGPHQKEEEEEGLGA